MIIKGITQTAKHPLFAIFAIILFFFISKWTIEGAYFHKDLVIVTIPLENLYRNIQLSNETPLWAPELAGGYPLLATGQLGYWYPPHMLLRQFLPGVWTLNISLLLHALLGAGGMYVLLVRNKLHPSAAAVSAILFALGTNIVGHYESLNVILPFMWVPLLLLYLQQFMITGNSKYFFLWISLHIFSIIIGHPQMAVYIFILLGIFVLTLTALNWRRWPRALASLLGVALIIGITSFYWLPILDVLPDTDRANGTLKPNAEGHFDNEYTPEAFLGLIIPHPFGHHDTYHGPPAENSLACYYGPAALLIALLGLIRYRRYDYQFIALVFIASGLTMAIGGYSPIFSWLVDHGWTYFNFPSRFFFYTHTGLVLLIAAGLEVSLRHIRHPFLRGLLIISILLPALYVSWTWHDGVPWKYTTEPAFASIIRQQQGDQGLPRLIAGAQLEGRVPAGNFDVRPWNPICNKCRYQQHFTSPFDQLDGIAIKASSQSNNGGTVTLRLYTSAGDLIRESNLPHHDIIDKDWTNFPFEVLDNTLNQAFYFELTSDLPADQAPRLFIHRNLTEQYDPTGRLYNCTSGTCTPVLDADAAFKIIVDTPQVIYYDAMAPYVSAGFGLGSTLWGPSSLPIQKVKEYQSPFDTWGDAFRDGYRTLMNRSSTTHVIGVFPPYRHLTSEGFTRLSSISYGDQELHLYRNDHVFPRLHFAANVRAYVSSLDQVNVLRKTNSQDQSTVLADIPQDMSFDISNNSAHFTQDERTTIQIKTEQQTDGFLVLRDTLLKGWQAQIDGQPTDVYRVDGVFRGLFVPAGHHTVTFIYQPAWISLALYVTGISLTAFLLIIVILTKGSLKIKPINLS